MADSQVKRERAHWESDFPYKSSEDGYTTRREFTKFLGLTSISFFLGTCWAAARRHLGRSRLGEAAPVAVASEVEMKVGGYKLFRFPEENGDPCILIRLEEFRYVAFSQSCTHLACPVHFNAQKKQLICPCHSGFFSAEDGRVIAGPPKRPLQRYEVGIRGGKIWVSSKEA